MFSHPIMFIGAFIAWVRHPSILFTFILIWYNAFIISVIVIIRRSINFTEHFLWHLITVGKNPSMLNWFPAYVVQMGIFPHMSHDWLAWVLFITAWHGGREAKTNFFICCDILGPCFAFWIKVSEDGHRWLLCPSCCTACMCSFNLQWTESCNNSISLAHVKASGWSVSLSSARKACSLHSDWMVLYSHSQCTHGR